MKHQKLTSLLLVFIAMSASITQAQTKDELVDEYMALIGIEQVADTFVEGYFNELERIYPHLDCKTWSHTDFQNARKQYKQDLLLGWRDIYKNHLSLDELGEMIAFLETPTGQKFLSLTIKLDPLFADLSNQLGAALNDKMFALIDKHDNQ